MKKIQDHNEERIEDVESVLEERKMHISDDPAPPGLEDIDKCSAFPQDDIDQNSAQSDSSDEEVVSFSENTQDIYVATEYDVFPNIVKDPEMKCRLIAAGPHQPDGPFPRDETQQGRSFSNSYYRLTTKAGLKLNRNWLCYSMKLDCIYCLPCWLFPQQQEGHAHVAQSQRFSTSGVRDWKHISERIISHEGSRAHARACIVYEQWRKHGTVDEIIDRKFEEERSFWRKVVERILNVTLTLATCNLAFRGTSERLEHSNKGNFLSIIELLSKYDPVLQELLKRPHGAVKYLSPQIQNELIGLLSSQVKDEITCELQNALFFSVILDTTQDVSKADQLSEVYRYVKIENDETGKPVAVELKICEVFFSFREVKDQSAQGLAKEIINSLEEKGLDVRKCRGQGYDGAAVMTGVYHGVQQRIKEKAPYVYIVHCAAHNLNLVLSDAVEGNGDICQFFETVQNVYCFFGHSIVRWEKLKTMYQSGSSKVTLKTLNPTRWAGRFDAVSALKHRFCDVVKCLSRLILTSKKKKERDEAMQIKKKLESFNFVLLLVIQCEVLEALNIVSKSLQSETVDLLSAYELLGNALLKVTEMRGRFGELVSEASEICERWGISQGFRQSRIRKVKKHFDELCEDERLQEPESCFRVTVFYPMIDTLCTQLDNRFQGMKAVLDTYQVIQPEFLVNASAKEVHEKAVDFVRRFPDDVSPTFPSQICSVKTSFKDKLEKMSSVKEFAELLIIDHSSLSPTYSDVCTACIMYLTVPVTVAKAERSFSKLKLIKNYL